MRGRGLKHLFSIGNIHTYEVAPHAGAWIETPHRRPLHHPIKSPPMRGRGLKPMFMRFVTRVFQVAPHAGAWIETHYRGKQITSSKSRPPCGGVD